jgi:high-affinity iron transporter
MLAAAIIVFREMVEAGLVVGIVMAVTRGVAGRGYWVSLGIAGGLAGSCIVALFAGVLAAAFNGAGQELFNAGVLGLAALMLAWHNIWMARHGRVMAAELRAAGQAAASGATSLAALAIVIGIAVLREGSEVVLFMYGIVVGNQADTALTIGLGALGGLVLGAGLSLVTYLGLIAIPARWIFSATSALLAFLAAGMAGQSAFYLERAGVLGVFSQTAWDTSAVLSQSSLPGQFLHALVGYADQPSVLQVTVYAAALLIIVTLMRLIGHAPQRTLQPA